MRSWFTIRNKIILTVSLVLGIVFVIVGFVLFQQVKSAHYDKIQVRLETLSQKLRDEIDEQYEEHRFPRAAKFHRLATEALPFSVIQLYDSIGSVVYVDSLLQEQPSHLPKETAKRNKYFKNINIHHHKYRSLWNRIEIMDNHQWLLQVAAPLENMEDDLERLMIILWTTLLFALLLSAFAVNYTVRRSFQPLSAMIETTDRISASSLHERIPLKEQLDEVSVLGSAVNRMINRLESAFKNQKQFIADASHELRTPLAIIQSELEFANRSSLEDPAKQSIQIALEELDHLRKLSSDLLLLAKLESADDKETLHSVRIDELVADAVQRMSRIAKTKNISVHVNIEDALEVLGNEERLRSAFLNLIENALKYTPAGGTVSVDLRRQGQMAKITVEDTGIGIQPVDLPHIFKPFYRSDGSRADHSGSGLGLSLVQRIVELYSGNIVAQSNGTNGSIFIVELPAITK
jgi:signal transduction histidine kinase